MRKGIKRFYASVETGGASGRIVLLDGKNARTPLGRELEAPTRALAEAVAQEWRGQGEELDLASMPLTKLLNTALDRVPSHREAVIAAIAAYARSDLLCYRAETPEELARRQRAAWDNWLDWSAARFGATLAVTTGVVHVEQNADALARLREAVAAYNDVALCALHEAVTLTGSLVLGLALAGGEVTAEEAMAASLVDETFQAERWGRDAEAEQARANRLAGLAAAESFLALLRRP